MPPKVTDEQFLVSCIKRSKNQLDVDFDDVAGDVGMSSGGARNKFRFIMKRIEAEREGTAEADAPAATPKTPKKRVSKAANGEDGQGSVKKPRSTKKTAKTNIKEEVTEDANEDANGGAEKPESEEKKGSEGENGGTDGSASA